MMRDSIGISERLHYIGFEDAVPEFDVPATGAPHRDAVEADQFMLWVHVHSMLEHSKQLWIYALHYMTPPYSFATLLNPSLVAATLIDLKRFWELILRLERSSDSVHKRFLNILTVRKLVVVREVCNLLEASSWHMTGQVASYVQVQMASMLHRTGNHTFGFMLRSSR